MDHFNQAGQHVEAQVNVSRKECHVCGRDSSTVEIDAYFNSVPPTKDIKALDFGREAQAIRSMDWREIEERWLGHSIKVVLECDNEGVYCMEIPFSTGIEFDDDVTRTQAARAAALVYEFFKEDGE